jgi:hypothetical protein
MSMADLNEKTTRLQLDLKQENAEHGALEAKLDETNAQVARRRGDSAPNLKREICSFQQDIGEARARPRRRSGPWARALGRRGRTHRPSGSRYGSCRACIASSLGDRGKELPSVRSLGRADQGADYRLIG